MLSHSSSTLDDITYSPTSKKHHRRHRRHRRPTHPKSKRSSNKYNFNNYASDKCAVCLDDATTLDTKLFPCGHTFHGQCLIQWVTIQTGRTFNCPLCRQDIAHFIQMTGNQHINNQLLQLWNQHYLYRTQTETTKPDTSKPHKNTTNEPVKTQTVTIRPEPGTATGTATEIASKINIQKSDCLIWKFLWNSPLSLLYHRKINSIYAPVTVLNLLHFVYQINISPDMYRNEPICNNVHTLRATTGWQQLRDIKYGPRALKMAECKDIQTSKEAHIYVRAQDGGDDLLSFSSLNLECGVFAGICAATTTFLSVYKGSVRNSFKPILSETAVTVPNVAIFFTSYEHLKRYMFGTDIMTKSYSQTFLERFAAAGIASSVGYVVSGSSRINGGHGGGLLPLRFAGFFGTFEFCKDLLDFRHGNIGLFGVAASAAIGGTVSHSLYYPLLQCKNMRMNVLVMEIGGLQREMLLKGLFRGWASSLAKFLPSCVACSCAFEYSKRYLLK